MTRAEWESLSRAQQLRIIHAMQASTVKAWDVPNIIVERMLNGMWDAEERLRKNKGPVQRSLPV
jgi:hypothetical protein